MIKLVGIILIVFTGAGIGIFASEKLKQQLCSCKLLIEMFNSISVMIRYRAMDFYEVSKELKENISLSKLEFISQLPESYNGTNSFSDEWHKAVESDSQIGFEEKEILHSFASNIGTSDIEGQLSELELVSCRLKAVEEKRKEDYIRKGKLYRSVGVLAGIMAGIAAV